MRYAFNLFVFSCAVLCSSWLRADVPVSGKADAKFAKFDAAILQHMREQHISCATLAIRVNNRLVYERGYGWCDEAKQKPVQPDAKFRIASLTKPITAAAVDVLVRQKKLMLQSKAFELLSLKPAENSKPDPRLGAITIEHLLRHMGGWDRNETTDPTWDVEPIRKALNLDRAPTPEEIIPYVMRQPLQFDPGARRAYSNVGYMVLGLIIKKYGDDDYHRFVQKYVFDPTGVKDAVPVRSLLKDCDSKEVWYADDRMTRSMVEPQNDKNVPLPYGGFVAEYRYAVGGWVMSAGSYARFMETYALYGDRYQQGGRWKHSGAQPGVSTIALWRKDGTKIVAFFNRKVENPSIDDRLGAIADEIWPDNAKTAGPKQR